MSKKKKNTYLINFNVMCNFNVFSECKETPLPLLCENGVKQTSATGWIKSKPFPNPCAYDMAVTYKASQMGEKIASTIIEYLDKETNEPVVQLYPSSYYVFNDDENFLNRLNHASKRNFQRELEKRLKIVNASIQKTK